VITNQSVAVTEAQVESDLVFASHFHCQTFHQIVSKTALEKSKTLRKYKISLYIRELSALFAVSCAIQQRFAMKACNKSGR